MGENITNTISYILQEVTDDICDLKKSSIFIWKSVSILCDVGMNVQFYK